MSTHVNRRRVIALGLALGLISAAQPGVAQTTCSTSPTGACNHLDLQLHGLLAAALGLGEGNLTAAAVDKPIAWPAAEA